jgi:hypothetical protein
MEIRIRETGQVVNENEFRTLHSTTSFNAHLTEEVINALGADVVFEGPQATEGTRYQTSQRNGIEQIDGKWYTKYILGPVFTDIAATETSPAKTAAEQEAAHISQIDANRAAINRQERDTKLASSDWTQVADVPVDQAAWATYRQALRDVPSQSGFPWEVIWPGVPGASEEP